MRWGVPKQKRHCAAYGGISHLEVMVARHGVPLAALLAQPHPEPAVRRLWVGTGLPASFLGPRRRPQKTATRSPLRQRRLAQGPVALDHHRPSARTVAKGQS